MTYRLSICIPTYNREVYLENLLASIFEQIGDEQVQVVVSDNGSVDATSAVAARYAARPNFRYLRRDRNAGAERNVLDVVAAAEGEHCWLFADDEKLVAGGIAAVLRLLQEHQPDLLHVSTDVLAYVDETKVFGSFRELVGHFARTRPETLLDITLMTTMILRRAVWESVANKERFAPTRYMQALVPAVALRDRGRIVVSPERVVGVRAQRAAFADEGVRFEMRYLHLNYLLMIAAITGTRALDDYTQRLRRSVFRGSAGDFARLTARYVRNGARLLAFTLRALLVRRSAS